MTSVMLSLTLGFTGCFLVGVLVVTTYGIPPVVFDLGMVFTGVSFALSLVTLAFLAGSVVIGAGL